jgi:hypothetical protein
MIRLCCLVALAAGCTDREVIGANGDGSWVELRIGVERTDVDLLFVIDNSPSMAPKQSALQQQFAGLWTALDANAKLGRPAHFHVGVVTTDLGAQQFNLTGQCRPGGDGARLQALGAAATPDCLPPTGGVNFIDYNQLDGANNLPAGQDVATMLRCMTSVGDLGCGFEQPLEAALQALQTPGPPENAGFLRDDALLAVVIVTDEDDCSAPPDGDLFDPAATEQYGALLSYRCTQFGVVCGTPPAPPPYGQAAGPLEDCAPAPDGQLYGVGRYLDFFRQPKSAGGVKSYPGDAFLFAIAAPPQPFSVLDADVQAPPGPYVACPGPVDGAHCATVLQHSCEAAGDPAFFGDPAVRLDAVVSQTLPSIGGSICDTNYQATLAQLAATLTSFQSGNGCLPGPLDDPDQPDCQVSDDPTDPDGSTSTVLPWCPQAGAARPCWFIDSLGDCGSFYNPQTMSDEHLQLVIDRGGAAAPPGTVTHARCVIVS